MVGENYNKEAEMTSVDQCSDAIQGIGAEYFIYYDGSNGGNAKCMACEVGTQDGNPDTTFDSIYKQVPNYPLNLQDPADNKQCTITCDPTTPYDSVLGACMSDQNIDKITCKLDHTTGLVA